jgi:hypothetical protein
MNKAVETINTPEQLAISSMDGRLVQSQKMRPAQLKGS